MPVILRIIHNHQRNCDKIGSISDWNISVTRVIKQYKAEIDEQVSLIDRAIAQYEIDKAKREKKVFDLESIKERLNTFIDLKGYKVNEEMIDMFVERIIYRGIVNGNDEFLCIVGDEFVWRSN